MSNKDDPSMGEIYKTITKEVLKDPEFTRNLGRYTVLFLTSYLVIGGVELLYGLPVITLASTPLAAGALTFLVASVQIWIRSGKPQVIYYLCSNPKCPRADPFVVVKWSAVPLYRKQRGCRDCGGPLTKTCKRGKHFIVPPNPDKPHQPPDINGFCPFCDPKIPLPERAYL